MTTRARIHELVDQLADEKTAEALDYLGWLLLDEDEASPEELAQAELGRAQIARGEYITLEEVKRSLLPTPTG